MTISRLIVALPLLLGLSACQTTGSTSASPNPFVTQGPLDRGYHLFFSPADHIDELLGQGQVEKASQVWSHQAAFFRDNDRSSVLKSTRALDAALSDRLGPRLDRERIRIEAVSWPAARSAWPEIKATIESAEALKAELDTHLVLMADGQADERHRRFLAALAAKTAELKASAPAGFRAEDAAFFADYPVALDPIRVLAEAQPAWSTELAAAQPDAILAFRDRYEKSLDEQAQETLGRLHYRAIARGDGIGGIVAASAATRAAKLPLRGVSEDRLAVVEIAPAASSSAPLSIAAEPPFAVTKLDLDDALAQRADLLLLLDPRGVRVERRPSGREAVKSEYQSSLRHDDNPQFTLAKADLRRAEGAYRDFRRRLARREDRCGLGLDCVGIAAPFVEAQLESDVAEARQTLAATPPKLPVPGYSSYSFTKMSVEIWRGGTVAYYLIDRKARLLMQGVADFAETKNFLQVEGLHDRDRHRNSHMAGAAEIRELTLFEASPLSVPLAAILADLETKTERRPLLPAAEMRREILADRGASSRASTRQAKAGVPAAR